MSAVVPTREPADRYRIEPTVGQALRNPRLLTREVLAGLVVAIALIPEAIAFSIIAGVDPRFGLFSSFVMAVAIAFLGGRPAMITAATGAVALVIAPVARQYGIDYFIATVIYPARDGREETLNQLGGRYVDRLVRERGAWRIKERICVREWSISHATDRDWLAGRGFEETRRGGGDHSYPALGLTHSGNPWLHEVAARA